MMPNRAIAHEEAVTVVSLFLSFFLSFFLFFFLSFFLSFILSTSFSFALHFCWLSFAFFFFASPLISFSYQRFFSFSNLKNSLDCRSSPQTLRLKSTQIQKKNPRLLTRNFFFQRPFIHLSFSRFNQLYHFSFSAGASQTENVKRPQCIDRKPAPRWSTWWKETYVWAIPSDRPKSNLIECLSDKWENISVAMMKKSPHYYIG